MEYAMSPRYNPRFLEFNRNMAGDSSSQMSKEQSDMLNGVVDLACDMSAHFIRKSKEWEQRMQSLEQRAVSADDKNPWKSMADFLGAVRRSAPGSGDFDKRLFETRAATGLNESGAPEEGGFLIPENYSNVLMDLVRYEAPIASRCMSITAKNRTLALPAVDETSRANGSRWGGIQSTWDHEGDTLTTSKPKFRRAEFALRRLTAAVYVTDELLEDGAALSAYISKAFPAEAAYQLDSAIVSGPGTSTPLGILNSPALITVAKESGQTSGTINPTNLQKMFQAMLPECRRNAVWLVSPEAEEAIYTPLTQTTPQVEMVGLFTPGDAEAPYGRLMNRPVIPVEQASNIGTVGDIIFADLSKYCVVEKPIDIRLSMHVRFVNGEDVFRFVYRVDGQPVYKSPVTSRSGGVAKSAFVTLGAR